MWIPDLPTDGTPIFQQILAALERAISDGALQAGERLPPQRTLSRRLGVSVGTVTRAYEEADRRGLTSGLRFCIGAIRRDADFDRALGAIERAVTRSHVFSQRAVV